MRRRGSHSAVSGLNGDDAFYAVEEELDRAEAILDP